MARPFAAPPGIPEDRKRALVDAFVKTMKDPDFLADTAKMQGGCESGERRRDR